MEVQVLSSAPDMPYFLTAKFLLNITPTPLDKFPLLPVLSAAGLLFIYFVILFLNIQPRLKSQLTNFFGWAGSLIGLAVFLWWQEVPYLTLPLAWGLIALFFILRLILIIRYIFAIMLKEKAKQRKAFKLAKYF